MIEVLMEATKTITAKPAAELAPRARDQVLRSEELQLFELFANLKKPISVDKFPGSIVLRRFRKGDVICRQGESGHSAFYIVRSHDMQKLRALQAGTADAQHSTSAGGAGRQVATAFILSGHAKAKSGFLTNVFSRRAPGERAERPQFIPNDGPTDIDYDTRQATMREGDVFGEMSCMTLAPRSATIVADVDCYMIEFLRNIFDQMQRDAGYRQRTDALYAERVLSTHLRRLELFQDLTDEQIDVLRQAALLEVIEPGAVICKEGDPADSVYLIRSGVVQVVRGAASSHVNTNQSPPEILAYLSRGDCFGEMAVVLGAPRQATCLAYDHPEDDTKRKPGRVELVRIEAAAFQKLLDESPTLRAAVDASVSKRYASIVRSDLREAGDADTSLMNSEAFHDEGLVQGQNLLLIDLDRCTRCGDCVRACVNTHDDGYSRLFLDGPRFDRFLVPSACRQCLNPSCMIGCPVGSIQRGANGQIEIRDWCIGCGLCERQCPYDSIQMHDLGIIPEQSVGWQFAPASHVGNATWQKRRYRTRGWSVGVAPFNWTIDLFEALAASATAKGWQSQAGCLPEPICFRYEFRLTRDQLRRGPFTLAVASKATTVRAWINGREIMRAASASPKKAKNDELQARIESSQLRAGSNLLAVEISPPLSEVPKIFVPKYNQPILTARLDLIPQAGALALATAGQNVELEVELVKQKAVVCDLCSSLATQRPACVDQCPHEAAIRIDARFEFPVG